MAVMWAYMKMKKPWRKLRLSFLLNRIKKTDVFKDAYKDAVLAVLILMIEKSGDENKEMIIRMALSCI